MVRIDDELNIMKIDGETVLEVVVEKKGMKLKWADVGKIGKIYIPARK